MKMQKTLISLGTVAALTLSGAVLARPPGPGWGFPDPATRVEQRVQVMSERLDLTPEQQAQVRAILTAQMGSRQRGAAHGAIAAVLNDGQRAELEALRTEREVMRAERMAGCGGPRW